MLGPFNPPRNWHLGVWEAPKNNRFRAKNCHLWTFQKPHSDNFWGVKSLLISPRIFHVMFSPQAALFKPFLAARDDYGHFWSKNCWQFWPGVSPVRYIDIEYRLSIYQHFWKISIRRFWKISISIMRFWKISIRRFWEILISIKYWID